MRRALPHRLATPVTVLLLTAGSLAGQALPRVAPEDVGVSAERLQALDEVLHAYMRDGRLPGGVALVARRGGLVHLEAFGHRNAEAGDGMDSSDIFRIASQTKALISVGIMMLQERGMLLIKDPVGRHLPSFRETTVAVPDQEGGYDVVAADRPVTLRDLLTHTSGVNYGGGLVADRWREAGIQGWYFAHRSEPIGATVGRMASLPFAAQPGEAFVYGYSTDILGAVIEQVSGLTLDAFLRTWILEPLGMEDTHFYLPTSKADRLTTVYNLDRETGLSRAPDGPGMNSQGQYVEGPRTSFSGGAGLLSTALDYGRFLQMLLNGGELDGVRLLSPKSVDLMTTNHVGDLFPVEGEGFGLGFRIVEDVGARGVPGSRGEFGWGGAYHSVYWVDPAEDLVVVYLTQVRPAPGLDDFGKLRAIVYGALEERFDSR